MNERVQATIAAVAGRQRGNITYQQLLRIGLSADAVRHLVRIGYLHRVHRGVYSVGCPPRTPADRAQAAVLACGAGAALARFGAVAHWSVWEHWPTTFDVIAPTDRRRPGITTHQIVLPDSDVRHHDGIRLAAPARALLDCAPALNDKQLRRLVNNARVNKATRVTDAQIADIVSRNPRHPGAGPLGWFVGEHVSESALEDVLYPWCDTYNLPRPQTQVWIRGFRVDAVYEAEKVVLELDGYLGHSGRESFESDRDRDAELIELGFIVIRITWTRFQRQPAREAERLRRILAARRAEAA